LNAALTPLLESPVVLPAVVQATKAAVLPELLLAMADMLDETNRTNSSTNAIADRLLRNHITRMAAVKGLAEGKWDDFDRIIDSLGNTADADAGAGIAKGVSATGGN
jgi:hypothetical protein